MHPFLLVRPHLRMVMLLLSGLGFGCTEAGSPVDTVAPTSNGSSTSGISGINGSHNGEVWTASTFRGSERFNLQTGESIKFSETQAFPNIGGSAFVEVFIDNERADSLSGCLWDDIHQFNIKNTGTGAVTGSFGLRNRNINFPVRLSPDGQRIAMVVAEDGNNCGATGSSRNKQLSIFSKDGEELYRHINGSKIAFDWHPEGYLVIVEESPVDSGKYVLQIENEPGSFRFIELGNWDSPPGVTGYIAFRVSPNGREAVVEEVTDAAHFLSGFSWRDGRTLHFSLFENIEETRMFQFAAGDTPRVNAPAFSPDGQHILVTEGFSQGSVVFNATSLELDTLGIGQSGSETNELGSLSVLSASSGSKSYIVSASAKLQPMPPPQYSDNIRPVLADARDGTVSIVSFDPIYTVTWTPVID